MAVAELESRGWHVTGDYKTRLSSDEPGNIDSIIKTTLDTDLKEIGATWLHENINSGAVDHVEGPGVLQLEELCGVSSPKYDDIESQLMGGIFRLSLSDGHITCSAVTLEPIKGLSLSTPPGSKVLLSGKVEVNSNFLLLVNKNTCLLGGRVASLAEPWELKKNLVKEPEPVVNAEDKRPPPFVPFGQKISSEMLLLTKQGNFQSLVRKKEKKVTPEEAEFQRFRQAALSEACKDKVAKDSQRAFRSGQVMMDYGNVRFIVNKGFSPQEAMVALQSTYGNLTHALNNLVIERQKNHGAENVRQPDPLQGSQPLSQGTPQNNSYSPNSHYRQSRQQDNNTQHIRIYQGGNRFHNFKQQQNQQTTPSQVANIGQGARLGTQWTVKQDGAKDKSVIEQNGSDASKHSAFSKQTQASLKENNQLQESNQSDRSKDAQKQQPQNNVSEKHNSKHQDGSSNQNGRAENQETEIQNTGIKNNLQEGSKNQDGSSENFQEQAVQNKPTNNSGSFSSDHQMSLTSTGDYKSSYVGAGSQQRRYHSYQNRDFNQRGSRDGGPDMSQHRPGRGYYTRSYNEQTSYGMTPHQTTGFRPPFGGQTYQPASYAVQGMCPPFMGQGNVRYVGFNNSGGYRGGYAGNGYGCFTDGGYNNYYAYGADNTGFTHEGYNRGFIHGGHSGGFTRGFSSGGQSYNQRRPSQEFYQPR